MYGLKDQNIPIMNAVAVSLTLHAFAGWFFLNTAQDITNHRVISPVEFFAVPPQTPEHVTPVAPQAVPEPVQENATRGYPRQVAPPVPVATTEPASESSEVSNQIKQKAEAAPAQPLDPSIAVTPVAEEPLYFRSIPESATATTASAVPSVLAVSRSAALGNNDTEMLAEPRFGDAYLHNPPLIYPFTAKKLKLQGIAVVRVLVSADGQPKSVELERTSGARILDDAAVEAVKRWSFVPARRGNNPITALVNIPIRFQLE